MSKVQKVKVDRVKKPTKKQVTAMIDYCLNALTAAGITLKDAYFEVSRCSEEELVELYDDLKELEA